MVKAFESFYTHLRRRFPYGQIDGDVWQAANGMAQGCPASPDLLNLLFEPFHRWAWGSGLGVQVDTTLIPSISFADDLALMTSSTEHMMELIAAYLEWCQLLGVNVTKVQLWCNRPGTHTIQVAGRTLETTPTFRFVGVLFGTSEKDTSIAHFTPRVERALLTTHRLTTIPLPASLAILLWRSTVLPQALYGCEIRDVRPHQMAPLQAAGRTLIAQRLPLQLQHCSPTRL